MRVVVVDDQRVIRDGLTTILQLLADVEVVGTAGDGAEAIELAGETLPDVILMDLRMPGVDGVEAIRTIRCRHPSIQIVVLTTYADEESVVHALSAGAIGYLTKDAGRDAIYRAISAAACGQGVLDPAVQQQLLAAANRRTQDRRDGLTSREAEVLHLMAGGLANGEIADRLYLSMATVKTHINRILAKTESRTRSEAIAYAHKNGLGKG
ncbi:response regulator transcription factor [Alicyclobacillus curvatus]|nr:response regulator transcription factor [Alicyclobacillus curvatus]